MMILYKFEIMNLIVKMDNCSLSEALEKWNIGLEAFDKRIHFLDHHNLFQPLPLINDLNQYQELKHDDYYKNTTI